MQKIVAFIKGFIYNILLNVTYYSRYISRKRYQLNNWPRVIGHALYDCDIPSNTLELYRRLIEQLNFSFVECDITFTKDHVPVLSHDAVLSLYKDGKEKLINICDTDYSVLRDYSLAKHTFIPLTALTELCSYISENEKCLMLDMCHSSNTIRHTMIIHKILSRYRLLDRTLFADGAYRYMFLFNNCYNLQFETDVINVDPRLYVNYFKFCNSIILSTPYTGQDLFCCKKAIETLHRYGLKVKFSKVDDAQVATKMLEYGVDFIITDKLTPNINGSY